MTHPLRIAGLRVLTAAAGAWVVASLATLLAHAFVGWYAAVGAGIGGGVALTLVALLSFKHRGSFGAALALVAIGMLVGFWLGALRGVHA